MVSRGAALVAAGVLLSWEFGGAKSARRSCRLRPSSAGAGGPMMANTSPQKCEQCGQMNPAEYTYRCSKGGTCGAKLGEQCGCAKSGICPKCGSRLKPVSVRDD